MPDSKAARGTYDPAYLNYTLGKLMIRKLRDDWTATRGGRQAWRDFHNQFLSYWQSSYSSSARGYAGVGFWTPSMI